MRMTKDEILFVVIVLLAFTVGAAARHYRSHHPREKTVAQPTPARAFARSTATAEKGPAKQR
jgi:hypothetical protein